MARSHHHHDARQDAQEFGKLGYAQELFRTIGGFSNFAISFSIISILTGAVTLYGHGLQMGSPAEMAFGWPLVSIFTLAVVMSMAELAFALPTSGAMYHWSCSLGGKGWAGSPQGSISSGRSPRLPASIKAARCFSRP
jgi:amino acid transporter